MFTKAQIKGDILIISHVYSMAKSYQLSDDEFLSQIRSQFESRGRELGDSEEKIKNNVDSLVNHAKLYITFHNRGYSDDEVVEEITNLNDPNRIADEILKQKGKTFDDE